MNATYCVTVFDMTDLYRVIGPLTRNEARRIAAGLNMLEPRSAFVERMLSPRDAILN